MLVVAKIKNNNKVNKKSIHINNSLNGEPSDLCIAFSALPMPDYYYAITRKGRRSGRFLAAIGSRKKLKKKDPYLLKSQVVCSH